MMRREPADQAPFDQFVPGEPTPIVADEPHIVQPFRAGMCFVVKLSLARRVEPAALWKEHVNSSVRFFIRCLLFR